MPRKALAADLQAEEAAVSSPLRRSSRITSVNSSNPAGIATRRTSQTTESQEVTPAKVMRGRRASQQESDEKIDSKQITRTRRASTQSEEETKKESASTPGPARRGRKPSVTTDPVEEETKKESASTPARRGRKPSVTTDPVEEPEKAKPVRGRRTSTAKSEESDENKPLKSAPVRSRRSSANVDAEKEAKTPARRPSLATEEVSTPVRRTTRSRRASDAEDVFEVAEEAKKPATRGRRKSVNVEDSGKSEESANTGGRTNRRTSADEDTAPKTAGRSRRTSVNNDEPVNDQKQPSEKDGINEDNNEALIALKEEPVKATPVKKRKIIEKVEAELDLSVINESVDDVNCSSHDEPPTESVDIEIGHKSGQSEQKSLETSENSPKKSESSPKGVKRLSLKKDEPPSPRKSPRLIVELTKGDSPTSDTSRRSGNQAKVVNKENNKPAFVSSGSDDSFRFHLSNVSLTNSSHQNCNEIDEELNSSKESTGSNKENVKSSNENKSIIPVQEPIVVARVSNVFKPNQKEYSFCEPMEVVDDSTASGPFESTSNLLNKSFNIDESVVFNQKTTKYLTDDRYSDISMPSSPSQKQSNEDGISSNLMDTEGSDVNVLIEETHDTVDFSIRPKNKKIESATSPEKRSPTNNDVSLVINQHLEQVKVVLLGKSSSPIVPKARSSYRKSRSPTLNVEDNTHSELESKNRPNAARRSRRSKSKSLSPSSYPINDEKRLSSSKPVNPVGTRMSYLEKEDVELNLSKSDSKSSRSDLVSSTENVPAPIIVCEIMDSDEEILEIEESPLKDVANENVLLKATRSKSRSPLPSNESANIAIKLVENMSSTSTSKLKSPGISESSPAVSSPEKPTISSAIGQDERISFSRRSISETPSVTESPPKAVLPSEKLTIESTVIQVKSMPSARRSSSKSPSARKSPQQEASSPKKQTIESAAIQMESLSVTRSPRSNPNSPSVREPPQQEASSPEKQTIESAAIQVERLSVTRRSPRSMSNSPSVKEPSQQEASLPEKQTIESAAIQVESISATRRSPRCKSNSPSVGEPPQQEASSPEKQTIESAIIQVERLSVTRRSPRSMSNSPSVKEPSQQEASLPEKQTIESAAIQVESISATRRSPRYISNSPSVREPPQQEASSPKKQTIESAAIQVESLSVTRRSPRSMSNSPSVKEPSQQEASSPEKQTIESAVIQVERLSATRRSPRSKSNSPSVREPLQQTTSPEKPTIKSTIIQVENSPDTRSKLKSPTHQETVLSPKVKSSVIEIENATRRLSIPKSESPQQVCPTPEQPTIIPMENMTISSTSESNDPSPNSSSVIESAAVELEKNQSLNENSDPLETSEKPKGSEEITVSSDRKSLVIINRENKDTPVNNPTSDSEGRPVDSNIHDATSEKTHDKTEYFSAITTATESCCNSVLSDVEDSQSDVNNESAHYDFQLDSDIEDDVTPSVDDCKKDNSVLIKGSRKREFDTPVKASKKLKVDEECKHQDDTEIDVGQKPSHQGETDIDDSITGNKNSESESDNPESDINKSHTDDVEMTSVTKETTENIEEHYQDQDEVGEAKEFDEIKTSQNEENAKDVDVSQEVDEQNTTNKTESGAKQNSSHLKESLEHGDDLITGKTNRTDSQLDESVKILDESVDQKKSKKKRKREGRKESNESNKTLLTDVEETNSKGGLVKVHSTSKKELCSSSENIESVNEELKLEKLESSEKKSTTLAKLDQYLESKIGELSDSSSDEAQEEESEGEYNEFIDGMAEECEEDTSLEDSNEIIDEGESIGYSSEGEGDEDDQYEADSFVCDDEEPELLSGEEYDLECGENTKTNKKSRIIDPATLGDEDIIKITGKKKNDDDNKPKKRSRIISISDSSDEEEISVDLDKKEHQTTDSTVISIEGTKYETSTLDDAQIKDKDSYIKLVIEESETSQMPLNNEEAIITIAESNDDETSVTVDQSNRSVVVDDANNANVTLNSSFQKRHRKSSLTIQENILIDGKKDPLITQRINTLVESFCSTVKKGEIAFNLSLEYEDVEGQETGKSDVIRVLSDIKICPSVSTAEEPVEPKIFTEGDDKLSVSLHEQSDLRDLITEKKMEKRLSQSADNLNDGIKKSKKRKRAKNVKVKRKTEDEEVSSAEDLRNAVSSFSIMNQLITDVKNRPKRAIKPSKVDAEAGMSWETTRVRDLKPSTSPVARRERMKVPPTKLHPKDFRNQMLTTNTRVKRVDTKTLLRKKGVFC